MTDTNKERAGRFTKKPVTIDAWLIDATNKPHPSWVHNAFAGGDIDWRPAGGGLYINTREGHMLGNHGDYLIRGIQSELYACKPDIFAATYESEARAAKAPAAPTQAEFALRALVAAGFVTQAKVNEAMTLPGAPPAATGYQQALDIRTAHGWKLGGDKIPVLYTDEINGQQVCRDDVWLCTTAAFAVPPAAEPVAYSLQWPDDVAHNRINISTTFDTEKEAQEWLDKCGAQKNIRVVPLTIAAPPAPTEQWVSVAERLPDPFCEVIVYPRPSDYCCEASVDTQGQWSYSEYETGFGVNHCKCKVTHWKPMGNPQGAANKDES